MKNILLLFCSLCSIVMLGQNRNSVIQNYLNTQKEKFGLSTEDVNNWTIQSTGNSESMGTDNYYLAQTYNGTEVHLAVSSIAIKNNNVIFYDNKFVSNLRSKIGNSGSSQTALGAIGTAYSNLGLGSGASVVVKNAVSDKQLIFSNGYNNDSDIKAKLVYYPSAAGIYQLAWELVFFSPNSSNLWNFYIDANNGAILLKRDMTVSCDFGTSRSKLCSDVQHNHNHAVGHKTDVSMFKSSVLAPMSGNYRVIPFNIESPLHGNFQLVVNPGNTDASPKGWHDVNTLTGNLAANKFTYHRGNNVWSRADYTNANPTTHNTNSISNGYSPSDAALNFDFPYGGTSAVANTYINASTTNLFYMCNVMHDVWHRQGFNEANGNFQRQNYGRGGAQADFVWADAHDGGGNDPAPGNRNNANFGTPTDGNSPRMQMFLWTYRRLTELLTVNSPADIAGGKIASDNGFDPGHVDIPVAPNAITSNLALMDDGTPDVGQSDNADGCSPAINAAAIAGKIVVIRRSTSVANGGTPCTFVDKALAGQAAGATAVIIVNNDTTAPNASIGMSGANASITIPVISISRNNGEAIIAKLKAGIVVNAKIQTATPLGLFVNTDGSFDNGVIAHEYGHGISTRLSGGAQSNGCLSNFDQMGEGWSDWFALMMQLKVGDVGTARRGIGNFVLNQPTTGDGLRSYPYTTDMTINPLTYVNSNSVIPDDPADTGYRYVSGDFWATVLWDLSWAYINKYGFDSNLYSGVGGNNRVMKLVVDGLKLQGCSPTVVSARDALFAAEQATTNGVDYCMIAEVFRRRGVGKDASAGSNNDPNDQVENFTPFPNGANCIMSLGTTTYDTSNINIYPNPSNGIFNIRVNKYNAAMTIQVFDLNGRLIVESNTNNFDEDGSIDLSQIQKGIYVMKLVGENLNHSQKISIN